VVPAWFEWDKQERAFWFVARQKSAWAFHMRDNPRVAISIDDEGAPYRKVQVQGTAEIVEEPNIGGAWVPIATRMSVRYLGEHGPEYLEPTLDKPRWLIRVRPVRMQTWQGVEWAPKYKQVTE
jgi:nitroimidazol reductase NimA-like FMN-containing flavoprotein (pyridoxamine 5'-phosphate oxidase superfamily)